MLQVSHRQPNGLEAAAASEQLLYSKSPEVAGAGIFPSIADRGPAGLPNMTSPHGLVFGSTTSRRQSSSSGVTPRVEPTPFATELSLQAIPFPAA